MATPRKVKTQKDEVLGRAEIADRIRTQVGRRFKKKLRAVFYELGVNRGGRLRADVVALAMNGYVVIVEVKSSVADFRTDKKMQGYLPYCNQFYLAVTKKVYSKIKDEIVDGAGVFVLDNQATSILKVHKAKRRDIGSDIAQNLAIRAAFRTSEFNTRKNGRA